ncbi:MAG: hypothetical protein ABIJ45_00460, partial [Candidatus Zixiibacteriota bacterium]
FKSLFPEYDKNAIEFDLVTIAIQINGKLRSQVNVPLNSPENNVAALAMEDGKIAGYIEGKTIIKRIYIPNKILNLVIK